MPQIYVTSCVWCAAQLTYSTSAMLRCESRILSASHFSGHFSPVLIGGDRGFLLGPQNQEVWGTEVPQWGQRVFLQMNIITIKCGSCECIATWGCTMHASPFLLIAMPSANYDAYSSLKLLNSSVVQHVLRVELWCGIFFRKFNLSVHDT